MSARTLIISLSDERATVLLTSSTRDGVEVVGAQAFAIPEEKRQVEPQELGAWLRKACDEAKLGAARVIFGESRHGSVAKLLSFDMAEDIDTDLPGMVRLQMIRQLSFPASDAVIDFVEVGRTGERIDVRAAAVTRARVQWYEAIARGAKWKVQRIGLRTSGLATIIGGRWGAGTEPVLILAAGASECEMMVLEGGRIVFSRSVLLPRVEDDADGGDFTRRLATEARRTWMSYRVGSDAVNVAAVVVLGDDRRSRDLATACGADLDLPAETFSRSRVKQVRWAADTPDQAEAMILAGLAQETATVDDVIDFAHPRQPPDRHARTRQRVLIGTCIFIAAAGSLFTWKAKQLEELEGQRRAMLSRRADVAETYQEVLRAEVLVEHIRRWQTGETDWLSHIQTITDVMPSSERVVLDGFAGQSETRVEYSSKGRRSPYDPKYWINDLSVRIRIEGRGVDRETTNAFREALVGDTRYLAVTLGNDAAARRSDRYREAFGLSLTSQLADPAPEPDVDPARAPVADASVEEGGTP